MPRVLTRTRFALTLLYLVFAYVALFCFTAGSSFCSRPGEAGHAVITLRLALASAIWYLFAGSFGAKLGAISEERGGQLAIALTTVGILTLFGFASIPFWIYEGYGVFMFEGTVADVSCFFTEGYGMMFPIFMAPILAVGSVVCEYIVQSRENRDHLLASIR